MIWIWFVRPFLGYGIVTVMACLPGKTEYRQLLKICLFWSAILFASFFQGWTHYIFLYWLVPLVFCKETYLYWSEIADHFNAKSGYRTRTGTLSNILFHNDGYHHAHHRHPGVPSHNLKRAHALTVRDGDDISRGFFETYRQLRAVPTEPTPQPAA